jgi:hypothetical protein
MAFKAVSVYTRPHSARIINSRYWPPDSVLFEITLLRWEKGQNLTPRAHTTYIALACNGAKFGFLTLERADVGKFWLPGAGASISLAWNERWREWSKIQLPNKESSWTLPKMQS